MNLHHDRIKLLAPMLQPKAEAFLELSRKAGYRILVVRTWESAEAQWLKFQQGREIDRATGEWEVSDKGKVVTNARPDQTSHTLVTLDGQPASMGIDIIPLDITGTPLWGLPGETAQSLDARWRAATGRSKDAGWAHLYQLAGKCGLDAYGDDWGAVLKWDEGHMEEPAYRLCIKALGLKWPSAEHAII